jgi:spermidine synthase
MNRAVLYSLSFFTNAAILVFEITGGRLLAPYIGTSVQVWAALIAVVLGGMAIGYHYGGRFADTNSSMERIGIAVFAAGVTALFSWSIRDVVGTWVGNDVSVELGALVAGVILFMPTVTLLAAVSPILAKNLVGDLSKTGKTVGELTAAGTAGSIFGALATGLYLIPSFGVGTILLSVALFLLAIGLIILRTKALKFIGITVACAIIAFFLNGLPTYASGTVADVSTAYNRIFVRDGSGGGYTYRAVFTSPGGVQCVMRLNTDGTMNETYLAAKYEQAHAVATDALMPEGPESELALGGCVLTFPRYLSREYPNMKTSVVEIDPGMTQVAKDYFSFNPTSFPLMSYIYEDARTFLNKNTAKYDLVYWDAYDPSGRVPFQLATKEAFQKMANAMTDDGLFLMNSYGSYGGEGALFPSVFVKTAESAFASVALYKFGGTPQENQNLVIVGSLKPRTFPDTMTDPKFPGMTLTRVTPQDDAITLTDDYAPVEGVLRNKLRI